MSFTNINEYIIESTPGCATWMRLLSVMKDFGVKYRVVIFSPENTTKELPCVYFNGEYIGGCNDAIIHIKRNLTHPIM